MGMYAEPSCVFTPGDTLEDDVIIYDEFYEECPSRCRLTVNQELFNLINHLHQICIRYNLKYVARYCFEVPNLNHEWLDETDDGDTYESACRIETEELRIYKDGDFQIVAWQKHSDTRILSPHWALKKE